MKSRRLPPGRQVYDALNGLRVGAIVGAIVGALASAALSLSTVWLIASVACIGGVAGYLIERRAIARDAQRPDDG